MVSSWNSGFGDDDSMFFFTRGFGKADLDIADD